MCYQEIAVGIGNNSTLIHNLHFLIKSHINLAILFFSLLEPLKSTQTEVVAQQKIETWPLTAT